LGLYFFYLHAGLQKTEIQNQLQLQPNTQNQLNSSSPATQIHRHGKPPATGIHNGKPKL